MPALQTKHSNAPYNGMATNPSLPPLMQPLPSPPVQPPVAGQQAPGQAMPGMMPPKPSVATQAAGMTGGGRQMRGYGNTPLKQNSGTAGTPGRPPVGTKKSAAVQALLSLGKKSNANCYPMMSMTGPLSGTGPAGVGMKPPMMSAPMSSISGMNSITPNVGAAVKTGTYAGCGGKKMKKSVRRIKKAGQGLPHPSPTEATLGQLGRDFDYAREPNVLTPLGQGVGAAAGLGTLGALAGAPTGLMYGMGRGNAPEGLGRGILRGGATGAGMGLGGVIGSKLTGDHPLGTLTGAGLGSVLGWNAAGHVMGPNSTKKEKDKTDQEKGHEG